MSHNRRSGPVRESADRPRTGPAGELLDACPPALRSRERTGSSGADRSNKNEAPKIIVSSRNNHPVPPVAGAQELAETAQAHGWTVKITYALAWVPARYHRSGVMAKDGHRLASVAVRLRRGPDTGWALWRSEHDGPWKFDHAFVGLVRHGWSRSAEVRLSSVLQRVEADPT